MIILPFSSSFSANRSSQATRRRPYKIFRMLLKITVKPILASTGKHGKLCNVHFWIRPADSPAAAPPELPPYIPFLYAETQFLFRFFSKPPYFSLPFGISSPHFTKRHRLPLLWIRQCFTQNTNCLSENLSSTMLRSICLL